MDNKELMEKLEKNSARQLLFTKILCLLCALVLVCALVLTVSITGAVRELTALAAPLQELTVQVQALTANADVTITELAQEADAVMADLAVVAEALAAADLKSIVDNINTLAAESQGAVAEAMQKLDTIDIETLNKAIQDLSDVVEPLAKISRIW